jgi:hypothetical protein
MNTTMTAFAALTLVLGTAACSGAATSDTETTAKTSNTISGTWKGDPATAQAENSDSNFTLIDGEFTCNSCIPTYSTKADGQWQPIDRPGYDEMKVEVVDDNTVKTSIRFKGRELGGSTWTVSDDGSTLTQSFVNLDAEETTNGTVSMSRTADAPKGAHAMSGGWKLAEYGEISDAALLNTYTLEGDTVSNSYNGGSWSAKLGGDPVAIKGSESGTMVKVEKVSDNVYRETYILDNKTVDVTEMTIDGNTMSVVSTDPRDNSVFRYTAMRQ